jgi:DNA-binding response OmpR family regulator/class 3 adenylate cyclase/predicted ATPase
MELCVLVIADDLKERASIACALQSGGHRVELAEGAKRALKLAQNRKFAAAIVALREALAGEALVRELSGVVLNVIALVDSAKQVVRPDRALFPADAVLARPLDQRQLLATIAELRKDSLQLSANDAPAAVVFEGCVFDVAGRAFLDCAGRETPLTRSEAMLLTTLVRSLGRVLSRDELYRAIAGRGVEAYDRSVDILVGRLRRKIEPNPKSPRFILTVSGAGYKFAALTRSVKSNDTLSKAIGGTERGVSLFDWRSNDERPATTAIGAATPVSPSEQRQATVLCCGLANTAALLGSGDLEEVANAIGLLRRITDEVIVRLGGSIVRSAGEDVVALFGYPQAHEDDAERAVQAGLDVVTSFSQIQTSLGTPLPVQAVIATGPVLIGSGMEIIGAPVAVASRLRVRAPLNAPAVTAATRKLVCRVFDLSEDSAQVFDDFPEPVTMCQVNGRRSFRTRFESMRGDWLTPFVGRRRELEQLQSLWERAKADTGQVALVCGEPGIGKSRTFQALLDSIVGEPHMVIHCQCSPRHVSSPYHPIVCHLEHAAGLERDEGQDRRLEMLRTALSIGGPVSSLDLALCAALVSIPTGERDLLAELTSRRQRDLTNAALVRHILAAAQVQPLIVKLADAHWADSSTLELFGQLIASITAARVLVVASCRPEFFAPWLEHSHVTMLRLNRLEREAARTMVVHVANGALSEQVCDEILGKTDGVPLFVEEFTKTIVEFQSRRPVAGAHTDSGSLPPCIPETLADSLTARLDKVGDAKRIAQIGSAIGREFPYTLLAEVTQTPAASLRAALAQLAIPELIFVRGEPPDSVYVFKHALVQDAAYATLPTRKKRLLHARIARALEYKFPETVRKQPEIIAQHLSQAGQLERAIDYLGIAAHRALEQSAIAEAISHLTSALKLLRSLPESPKSPLVALGLETMLAQATIARHGYAAPQTTEVLLRAKMLIGDRTERPEKLAILYGLWAASYVGGSCSEQQSAANDLLAEAHRQGDSSSRCVAHRAFGTTCLNRGEFATSLPHLTRARELYDPERHSPLRREYGQDIGVAAQCYLSWALWHLGSPDQAEVIAGEAVERANELSHPHTLVYTLAHACGFMNIFCRRTDNLQLSADLMLSLCIEQGFSHWINFGRIMLGWAAICHGELDPGIDELVAGIAGWQGTGSRLWLPIFHTLKAEAYAKAGRPTAATQAIEEGISAAKETGEIWALAEVLRIKANLWSGIGEAADNEIEALLKGSLNIARCQRARSYELRTACDLARLWQRQGKWNEASSLLRHTYDQFTEGFETKDLREATKLIQDLARACSVSVM